MHMRPNVISLPASNPVRNGFSLVEMMVVVFIMGLLATAAVLTLPGNERKLRDEAERFAARTLAARDEAIVGARPVALVVSERSYYFERRVEGNWQPLPGRGFDLTGWNGDTRADLGRQRIIFDSLGLASTDAVVRLRRDGATLSIHLRRDGKVSVDGT